METLEVIEQHNNETREVLPSESTHWYDKNGSPVYEVEAKKGGMRATTIADARKLGLVPSVTNILNIAAKPGLEAWKAKQILEASLTLPRITEESLDDYAARVMEDAKAQSKKAMERGTQLHAAIEDWIKGQSNLIWGVHIEGVSKALEQLGIDLTMGKAEHSFASPLGYGGKIDFHNEEVLIDFKTRAEIDDKKRLAYDEHVIQLSAYGYGLGMPNVRCLNVFIGVLDKQIRVVEHSKEDTDKGFRMFKLLLEFWKLSKNFNP